MKKIVLTIYYDGEIDKKAQIEKLKLICDDFDSMEVQFFNFDDITEGQPLHCDNCGNALK